MTTAKDLLTAMGFEHQQHTYTVDNNVLITSHMITHPDVPGLFLAGPSLERTMRGVVWAIQTLTCLNELKIRPAQLKAQPATEAEGQ